MEETASVKIHVFRSEMGDHGTTSCDFREGGEQGAGENDQHRTVLEVDPAPAEVVDKVLKHGPATNELLQSMFADQPEALGAIASALGLEGEGPVGLRLGVWAQ